MLSYCPRQRWMLASDGSGELVYEDRFHGLQSNLLYTVRLTAKYGNISTAPLQKSFTIPGELLRNALLYLLRKRVRRI